eukprot:m.81700 g.81700  ORF g.81700 m.81700 type:complete len:540 (+) comp11026_c0_seq1:271-1890(+)
MAGTSRWPWALSRPNSGEVKQFQQLYELFERLKLSDSEGGDSSWFIAGSGSYRGINDAHLSNEDLSGKGGIVCRPCHELRSTLSNYLRYRQENRRIHYPNDPLNCFFAELMGCLSVLALLGFGSDSDKLLHTVELRLHYLNEIVSSGIFASGYVASIKEQTKGHVILEAQEVFVQMRDDVIAAREHVTLVDTLRQLETSMGSFVLHGLTFATTAFRPRLEKASLKSLLEDPAHHREFLESSLGKAVLAVLQGPARKYAASTARLQTSSSCEAPVLEGLLSLSDFPAVNPEDKVLSNAYQTPTAATTITRLLFIVSTVARCTDIISHFIGAADAGGKLLVLGAGREHVRRWVQMSAMCLEEAMQCIQKCELNARIKANTIKRKRHRDPTADPWMKMRAQLCGAEGAQTLLLQTTDSLRYRLDNFSRAVLDFDPQRLAAEAVKRMNALAERTDGLYRMLAHEFALAMAPTAPDTISSGSGVRELTPATCESQGYSTRAPRRTPSTTTAQEVAIHGTRSTSKRRPSTTSPTTQQRALTLTRN